MAPRSKALWSLGMRVRRTLGGDGETTRHLSVFCARRGHAMDVRSCLACDECEGLVFDGGNRPTALQCAYPGAAEARSALPRDASGSAAARTPLNAVMTRHVTCVRADLSVEALTTLLLQEGISGVPVVDETGAPIGVVSKTDLLRDSFENAGCEETASPGTMPPAHLGAGFHDDPVARKTVGDVMTPVAFSLPEEASVARAAALMAAEGIHRLPVVSSIDSQVVGLVSPLDILRWLAVQAGYVVALEAPHDAS